jgi:hypothetical protein
MDKQRSSRWRAFTNFFRRTHARAA